MLHAKGQLNLEGEDYDAIIDQRSRTTMGQVITVLRKYVSLPPEDERLILEGLRYRNYIVHSFFNDHSEHFFNHERCQNVADELSRMALVIRDADQKIRAMFFEVMKVFGLTPENYWSRINHVAKEIQTGKTLSQAVADSLHPKRKE